MPKPENKSPSEPKTEASEQEQLEAMIDEALKESFPASDPPNLASLALRIKSKRGRVEADADVEKGGAKEKKGA